MDLSNEFDYMMIEFFYYATYDAPAITLHLREQEKLDYKMSSFLKEVYKTKVLRKEEIKKLSANYDTVKPLIEKIYDNYDFQDRVISYKVPEEDTYHILDNVEIEARKIIDNHVSTFATFRTIVLISPYTYSRIYDDFELLIKTCDVINNKNVTTDEELCNEIGIIYYNDKIHWPILEKWLIDNGCDEKHLFLFRLKLNALYAWEKIHKEPNVTLDELKKELF